MCLSVHGLAGVFLLKEGQKAERVEKPCSPFTPRTGQLGTGGLEEAAGHPLLDTESHTRHRRKQRAAQEAAHQRSLAG